MMQGLKRQKDGLTEREKDRPRESTLKAERRREVQNFTARDQMCLEFSLVLKSQVVL